VCGSRPWICNGFVSIGDPVFGHAVHAPPHLHATVIVMSQTGDHLDVVEQGQRGEYGVFSPFGVLIAVG
jgi:hypothetical protein